MSSALRHPSRAQLEAFTQGRLQGAEHNDLQQHLSACVLCRHALGVLNQETLFDPVPVAQRFHGQVITPSPASAASPTPFNDLIPPPLQNHVRYRVVRVLGSGGMGVVFQAEHRLMERSVASKVIHPRYTGNPQAVERFRREVKAAAQLSHPNIVQAYDAEQAGELHFLVMEFVEGINLAHLLQQRGPFDVATACGHAAQAARGLQHALERGMVHRDIKPHNLMLTPQGQVKILDFGLARLTPALAQDLPEETLTFQDMVVGTPNYLAPEQARNSRSADIRSDLYSLGCTLYHLLSGRPPFPHGTPVEKVLQHAQDEPTPIGHLRPGLPPNVAAVVHRLLAKDPAQRFQTPLEAAEALAAVAEPRPDAAAPAAPPFPAPEEAPARSDEQQSPCPLRKVAFRWWWLPGLAPLLLAGLWWVARPDGEEDGLSPPQNQACIEPATPRPRLAATASPRTRTRRVLFILPQKGLYLPDYFPVAAAVENAGFEVVAASSSREKCQPSSRSPPLPPGGERYLRPQLVLDGTVESQDHDAFVFVGANVADFLGESPAARNVRALITAARQDDTQILAGVCTGQVILAHHHALTGRKVAWGRYSADAAAQLELPLTPAPFTVMGGVVEDDRILTGALPSNVQRLAEKLVEMLRR